MRALIFYCPYLDRGVDCRNAPLNGQSDCGCKPRLRLGLSSAHKRKLLKQLGTRVSPQSPPRE
jgi:hypothetical protein